MKFKVVSGVEGLKLFGEKYGVATDEGRPGSSLGDLLKFEPVVVDLMEDLPDGRVVATMAIKVTIISQEGPLEFVVMPHDVGEVIKNLQRTVSKAKQLEPLIGQTPGLSNVDED